MSIPLRALLVEDSEEDAQLVVLELRRGGYRPDWLRVDTAAAMREKLRDGEWDVIISDYSLPSFSGLDALEILKSSGLDIPFLMVSGVVGEETAVAVMKAGAQDFFVKGQLGRLTAAIERELRDAADRRKQRQDEASLKEAEARFNAFMNNIPTPAWIKNEKFRYVYVNKPLSRLWERPVEDLVGCTDFDVMPREIARTMRNNDAQVLETNEVLDTLETVINADGEEAIFTVLKFPLYDATGRRHVAGVSLDITERVRAREQLEAANRRLQLLSSRVVEIQELERQHIARGLHDDIGQALTAIKINLESLGARDERLRNAKPIEDSVHIVELALKQVRTLSFDLRPPQLNDLGLEAALRWYVDRKADAAGVAAQLHVDSLPEHMHPDIETACFRIAQEAMTNVLRHAEARHVWVDLRGQSGQLHLMVRDDGRGCDIASLRGRAAQNGSLGLISMEERAALVGGRIEISSQVGRGTVVDAFLPTTPRPLPADAPSAAQG